MNNLKIIQETENPEILVLTPLLTGHSISKETKKSIKRNDIPFTWVSYENKGKHASNVQKGLEEYLKRYKKVPYFQIIDNDITLGRGMLDRLHRKLKGTDEEVAFAFCPFSYKGYINMNFPAKEYNIYELMRNNYISSNSLYKTDAILDVGGFVTDQKYHRLSDWCMWMRFYWNRYIGILAENAFFTARSEPTDISAGSNDEYNTCKDLVIRDFVWPVINREFNDQ